MTSSLNWAGRLTLIALFFSWGTMSVLIDVSIPYFKSAFELGYRDALLIQSSFFLAYLFLARLAGQIISRLGFRKGVFTGLSLMAIGAGALALATIFEEFLALLPSVFIIASGITFLQVSANPLAATMGLTKSPASNLTLAQGFNSLGTVTGPLVASFAIYGGPAIIMAGDLSPVRLLFSCAAIILLMLALTSLFTLQNHNAATSTRANQRGFGLDSYAMRRLFAGCAAIFLYVGAEVSIASTLINFLESPDILNVLREDSSRLVAIFWGGALIGRFLGVYILSRFRQDHVLVSAAAIAAILGVSAAMTGGSVAAACVLAIGLFNAVQFPVIFSICSSDLEPESCAKAAGWLCTAIVGGAVVPLLFGAFADFSTLQTALVIPAMCYCYIAFFAWRFGHRNVLETQQA